MDEQKEWADYNDEIDKINKDLDNFHCERSALLLSNENNEKEIKEVKEKQFNPKKIRRYNILLFALISLFIYGFSLFIYFDANIYSVKTDSNSNLQITLIFCLVTFVVYLVVCALYYFISKKRAKLEKESLEIDEMLKKLEFKKTSIKADIDVIDSKCESLEKDRNNLKDKMNDICQFPY